MNPLIHKNTAVRYYSKLNFVFSDMKPNFFLILYEFEAFLVHS